MEKTKKGKPVPTQRQKKPPTTSRIAKNNAEGQDQAGLILHSRERDFQTLVENFPYAITRFNLEGRVQYVNPARARLLGLPPKDIIGKTLWELPGPNQVEERKIADQQFKKILKDPKEYRIEYQTLTSQGLHWVETREVPEFTPDGSLKSVVVITRDITARKQAEKALQQTKEYWQSLVENTSDLVTIIDVNGAITYQNKAVERVLGYKLDEFVGKNVAEFIQAEDMSHAWEVFGTSVPKTRSEYPIIELRARHKDGTWRIMETTGETRPNDTGQLVAVLTSRDITERKEAEVALRESEERFRRLTQVTFEGIVIHDGRKILDANPAVLAMFDYELTEVIGKNILEFVAPESREIIITSIAAQNEKPIEAKGLRKDGTAFPLEVLGKAMPVPGSTLRVTALHDITIRKQAEKELEESNTKLRSLFAAMTDVVIVYDREGRYREIAPTDPSLLIEPPDELIGKSMYDSFPKPDADRLIQHIHTVLETGRKLEAEYSLQIGGRTIWFSTSITPMQADSVIWVAHDITDRKRAEKLQEVIYAISQAAISTESIDELYQSIHTTLAELVHVENFYIAIYDPSSDLISFPYFVDQYDQPPAETKPRRGLTEYVLRSGQPLLASARIVDQLIQKGEIEDMGTPSIDWLGVPLKVGGQVSGVMVTQSYQENIHFNQEDLRLFEFVSTQVALMIDRKRVEEKIRFLGMHDGLTGLYNRAYFDEELKRLEHGRLFPISVLMADIDKLKVTNDQEGHAAGDELLRQAAQALKTAFRAEDVVARIGGDEFAVLLPGMDASLAKKAKQRILDNIKKQNAERKGKPLQISMGFSTVEKGSSLVQALKLADDQMYAEKQGKQQSPGDHE